MDKIRDVAYCVESFSFRGPLFSSSTLFPTHAWPLSPQPDRLPSFPPNDVPVDHLEPVDDPILPVLSILPITVAHVQCGLILPSLS